ncbi:MAG: hypothetical protein GF329_12695 [Candidatus Lokiarchaeota archaeon]|nr:hypothetical protein [Candidatus Lokiarchaeota archaeon]
MKEEIKGNIILITGIGLMAFPAIIAILTIFGIFVPVIFPPTGMPLDVTPLVNALSWWLMLVLIMYIATRVIDWGIDYLKNINQGDKNTNE